MLSFTSNAVLSTPLLVNSSAINAVISYAQLLPLIAKIWNKFYLFSLHFYTTESSFTFINNVRTNLN